jgi:hypothetical protein
MIPKRNGIIIANKVGPFLHGPEERHRPSRDYAHHECHQGHDDDEKTGERHVLAERHDDAADEHDRGDDHDVEGHDQDHLNLLDVVRVARDQRRSAEDVGLLLGKAHHLAEDRAPHVTAERHGRPRAEEDGNDCAQADQKRDQQHETAGADDVAGVALDHAVVDDVGVQVGQVQVGECLHRHQNDHHGQRPAVGSEVSGEQSDHRRESSVFIVSDPQSFGRSVGSVWLALAGQAGCGL